MEKNQYQDLLQTKCDEFGLDSILVSEIVRHESAGNPWAIRYEHNFRWLHHAWEHSQDLGISKETEEVCQKTSWGLMQIMGAVARELGFKDHLTKLVQPELSLHYGCRKLKQIFRRWGDEEAALAAYNMGSPRRTPGGLYENQKNYVDPIMRRVRERRKLV